MIYRRVRSLGGRVLRQVQRFRLGRRGSLWLILMHRARPVGRGGWLRLIADAVIDTATFTVRPDRAVSPKTVFTGGIRIPAHGIRYVVRPGTDDLYNVFPFGEGDVHEALLGPLRPGDVFVDVGANVGYYTVLGGIQVGPQGRVVAVEALPTTAEQLRRNVSINGLKNVEIVQAAAYDRPGALQVRVPNSVFGMASVVTELRTQNGGDTVTTIPAVRLDDVCAEHDRIHVMKMDIEGAELQALEGARATLAKTCRVVIECNQDREKIEHLLREAGFRVTKLSFTTYVLADRAEGAGPLGEPATPPADERGRELSSLSDSGSAAGNRCSSTSS